MIISCMKELGQRHEDGTFLVDGSSFKLCLPACCIWTQKPKWHVFWTMFEVEEVSCIYTMDYKFSLQWKNVMSMWPENYGNWS